MTLKNSILILGALIALFLSSCTVDETQTTEQFVDETIENFEIETRSGTTGCFEIVYPISIMFPDSTILDAESSDEVKEIILAWKEDNPEAEDKPSLVYPIELINEDGEVVSAEDRSELRSYVKGCKKGRGSKGRKCFDLVYPVSVIFPDGIEAAFETKSELKSAVRAWKEENPDAEEKPALSFPIEVELKADESIVTVNSQEELQELKAACREE